MRRLEEIDANIEVLLSYLSEIQNEDGSFDTYYKQPYYNPEKGWMKYPSSVVYNTAQVFVPLLNLKSEKASTMLNKAVPFILNSSLNEKLWTFAPISKDYKIPYDTDSTSLASYVLTSVGIKIENREYLNSLINQQNHFPFYIKKGKKLPLLTRVKLYWYNFRMKRSKTLLNDDMRFNDFEFTSSCVNLLYLGNCKENKLVWKQLDKEIKAGSIKFLYYLDIFHAYYMYSRLHAKYKDTEFYPDINLVSSYTEKMVNELDNLKESFNQLLVLNSFLHLNVELSSFHKLIDDCFSAIENEKYKTPNPLYSSNLNTDCQPDTSLPNTYFGSSAITTTLYIEFLNLYRKNKHGCYFGENK